jgi:predicted DNA-binding transcriptional regulator YafY
MPTDPIIITDSDDDCFIVSRSDDPERPVLVELDADDDRDGEAGIAEFTVDAFAAVEFAAAVLRTASAAVLDAHRQAATAAAKIEADNAREAARLAQESAEAGRVVAITNVFGHRVTSEGDPAGNAVDPEDERRGYNLDVLTVACEYNARVWFCYQKPNEDEPEYRSVNCGRLEPTSDGDIILIGFDVERDDYRCFRLDRITDHVSVIPSQA